MDLAPMYGEPGVPLRIALSPSQVVPAVVGHRQRLLATLRSLDEAAWRGPTRCSGWDGRQLAAHMVDGTGFFATTLGAARDGVATRLLQGFDPVETPKQLVGARASKAPAEILAGLEAADAHLRSVIEDFGSDPRGDDAWAAMAEVPPGHVRALVALQHFMFDSWLHERDLLLPLGHAPPVDDGELTVVLSYLCGLAALASLRDLAPFPSAGEFVCVETTDARLVLRVRLGIPTVVDCDMGPGSTCIRVAGAELADAMSGRCELADVVDAPARTLAVLGGALPFLQPDGRTETQ